MLQKLSSPFSKSDEFHLASDDEYPAIEDYAVIGDCRSAALISRQGSVDWLCLPNFSGRSVFAALLDHRRGGRFAIRPTAPFRVERSYVNNSNVLQTTFITATGKARLTDFMPILSGHEIAHYLQPQRELLRILDGLEGEVPFEVIYEPRPGYAREPVKLKNRGALALSCEFKDEHFILHGDLGLKVQAGSRAFGECVIKAYESHYFSLAYTKGDIGIFSPLGKDAQNRLATTVQWWRQWCEQFSYDGPYRSEVLRSALTLKLLTYAISGAVVAAATTSLPERIGGVRNWDYRFCWLRDASLTLRAFIDLGFRSEGECFLGWLLNTTSLTRPRLQVLYDVYGEPRITEQQLDYLQGYRGSRPVRVGNGAWNQLQLDLHGSVILAAFDFIERGGRLDRVETNMLIGFGKLVCKEWGQPDQGIWEIRGEKRHHTYSKFMCWVALDRLIQLHEQGYLNVPAYFREHREQIRQAINSRAYNNKLGCYVDEFDGKHMDASVLLLGCYGFVEPNDSRMRGTFKRVEQVLGKNGYLLRYEAGRDQLPPGEGAFGITSFWAVDYLARAGDVDKARSMFEHMLGAANDLGLYAEEVDTQTGAALGNFPQAFTHVGLIGAALSITNALADEISNKPFNRSD